MKKKATPPKEKKTQSRMRYPTLMAKGIGWDISTGLQGYVDFITADEDRDAAYKAELAKIPIETVAGIAAAIPLDVSAVDAVNRAYELLEIAAWGSSLKTTLISPLAMKQGKCFPFHWTRLWQTFFRV